MTPRRRDPEGDDAISPRELQHMRKEHVRRMQGLPQAPGLAHETRVALWLYRELNHLSQQQLAELLGMKQPQIARLESGLITPSLETLRRISERLGIDFTIEVKSGGIEASATRPGSRPA
jgi:ribosome-binding protein aMBF1 (putative translation factor)